jgi:imidazolonepropionase
VINFHGDELHPVGSAELGADLGARAISHLEEISDKGIALMAERQIIGVLLPTTAYVLRITPPPARKMIDSGVPVALGSDFNPNAHCLAMPFVMNLACVLMKMTIAEALNAATINAAASLNRAETHGSIEVGKWANFLILNHSDWRHLIYELVDPPIESVWCRGKQVFQRSL